MKNPFIWGLVFLLGAGTLAYGQATLPTSHSGPWKAGPLPTGWTQTGLGNDYATDYDSSGANAAKFDGSGDFIQIYFSGAPSSVSYYARGNSLTGAYVYKVQESANGSTWTDVVTYTDPGNLLNNSAPVQYTNFLLSASRYVKFLYVTKVGGNVGLDGVEIVGPGVPAVTFDPSGGQSIPVSNLLTLAVTILPSGSGMQSWSLLPAYSGSASLVGGSFQFTPAAADSGGNFTLRVIATNSIGTSTGTVAIAVTAYVPPVPIVTFSPDEPYSIMATETQKLGVGVAPAGSGIQSWTLLPAYAGSASLVTTNFSFTPAEADGPNSYTLSIFATNVYGTTTGTADIAVTAYVPPPVPGSYTVSFEDGSKAGYASADVMLSNKLWNLDGILIGTVADDLKIGSKSARLKYTPDDGDETMTILTNVLGNGIGTISLWYGPYGSHGVAAPVLAIEVSSSLVSGWIEVGEVDAGAVAELTYYSADVYVSEPVYVRIRSKSGTADKSANFDNLTITPYSPPSSDPYDAFLLQYNVTPGDPGTAPGDDLDGDLVTNTNEFNAGTNPYDPALHP